MVYPLGFAENSIQLVPDGTLFLHVLIILVMVYVLNRTLFRPINRILETREKRTRGRLTEAEEIMANVGEKLTEYERALRAARTEAYALSEHERAAAMQDRQKKLDAMRAQLAASTAAEKKAIQAQAEAARITLEADARRIAVEIGSRVLSRPLTNADLN
ncbi:MAG: F-type H+-transporting ATPase subunit b [Blastocatellia bacterium]|jgi:F-type H+-transporting ATPase subunit b|nr:F-type H+-transporting ATPase subunit b [Blastocatellia bacterium]